jgi:hypothetical protein
MSVDVQAELKIPDMWYDFYARFVPGAAFTTALYGLAQQNPALPTVRALVLLGLASYLAAFTTQPFSSRITGLLHWLAAKVHKEDKLFVTRVAKKLPDERPVLDKMHAEVTCFVQLAVLTLALWLVRCFWHPVSAAWLGSVSTWWFLGVGCGFMVLAAETADRRVVRARDRTAVAAEV